MASDNMAIHPSVRPSVSIQELSETIIKALLENLGSFGSSATAAQVHVFPVSLVHGVATSRLRQHCDFAVSVNVEAQMIP